MEITKEQATNYILIILIIILIILIISSFQDSENFVTRTLPANKGLQPQPQDKLKKNLSDFVEKVQKKIKLGLGRK